MLFKNPMNGHVEEIQFPWLWSLVFGAFYFAHKGIWTHFVIGILVALMTCGISWFVYPFFAKSIVRNYYLHKGWQEL